MKTNQHHFLTIIRKQNLSDLKQMVNQTRPQEIERNDAITQKIRNNF